MSQNKHIIIILSLCLGVFLNSTAIGQSTSQGASAADQVTLKKDILKGLQELAKTAQTILDVHEIENLMSIHEFQKKGCVAPGDPNYRETVAQKTDGVSYGVDGVYVYGDKARRAMRGLDDPTFGRAGTLKMHMLTTCLLHVAGDGQTAKGIWYSPGFLTEVGTDREPKSAWDYKRYGVDFIKEDGNWRIWHMVVYTDFITPPNVSWTVEVSIPNTTIPYKAWSPSTGSGRRLQTPEPYETFSETFSYNPND